MKACSKCGVEKAASDFYPRGAGLRADCKSCVRARSSSRYLSDRNNILEKNRARADANRDLYLANKRIAKKASFYQRYSSDAVFKMTHLLRGRLSKAVKGLVRSGSAVRDLGCTVDELKVHLERLFRPGMTWDNYGAWHVDHVRPLASFDLTDREQFLQACHYTNLQPLWAIDNLKKGARV